MEFPRKPWRVRGWIAVLVAASSLTPPLRAASAAWSEKAAHEQTEPERKAAKARRKADKERAEAAEEAAEQEAKARRKQAKLDAKEIEAFLHQSREYMEVHEKVEKELGGLPPKSADPATVNAFNHRLAEGIRARRAGAKQGDIFTPAVRDAFLRMFRDRLVGKDGRAERHLILQEGNPLGDEDDRQPVPLVINGYYPLGAPLSTVPATLLQILPTLPEELKFRFVGGTLILRDAEANIIVDYLPHAVP